MDDGYTSLGAWAEDVASKTDPQALWEDLANKDAENAELQDRFDAWISELEKLKDEGDVAPRSPLGPKNDPNVDRLRNGSKGWRERY